MKKPLLELTRFRKNVLHVLGKRELTQRAFAKTVPVSHVYLCYILNGKKTCSFRLQVQIARALKIPVEELYRPIGEFAKRH